VGRALEGADAAGDLVTTFVSAGGDRATIEAKDERIETLEAENEQLRDRLAAVEDRLANLEAGPSARATGDD
jgi:cell division protein FtsB